MYHRIIKMADLIENNSSVKSPKLKIIITENQSKMLIQKCKDQLKLEKINEENKR